MKKSMVLKQQVLGLMVGVMFLSVATVASATVLLSDDFSGVAGAPLVGSALDVGGSWSKTKTAGGGGMNGHFLFADGGGIVASNNGAANAYTTFNASSYANTFTNGFTLSIAFVANGYADGDLFLGLAETIDKGYFSNLNSDDLIRFVYSVGGSKAGKFSWSVRDESVSLNSDSSVRAGSQTINPTDVVRLSITVYPKFGLVFGEAANLTQNYLISKSRIGVNTPGLTNMLYAGIGWLNIATNSEVPAVVSSFEVATAPDLTDSRLFVLATNAPPVMTGFAFQDMGSVTNAEFPYILGEHASVDIMHSVRPTVYDTVRATYPDKMMIKQMAWGGTAGIPLDTIWPGHCLMKAGTKLSADVAATTNDTVLYMQDYTRIAASQAAINNHADQGDADGYVLVYALDANGRPDWSRAEHVKLVSLNTADGGITVKRAQYGTSPQAFTNGQAAIARHMMFWSPSQWELNLSLESPRGGPFNMTAAEWFALQVAQNIHEIEADGVEMDVGRWQWGFPSGNKMDCDNDLVADYGYIGGVCSFGLGGQVLQGKLRELLGSNRIIQTDGNDALFGQRGWKYMNGVQLESFPTGGFDVFSERFRHLRQWVGSVDTQPAFSYPFTKTPTTLFGNAYDTDGSTVDWRFRVGFSAALLTGMPHPFASVTDINFDPANPEANPPDLVEDKGFYKWDEYVGGELNDWKWLGAPQGNAVQVTNNVDGTDLLASAVWQWNTESNFVSSCSISNGEYSAVITAIPSNTLPWTSSYYSGSQVPQALWFGIRLEIASGAPALVSNQEYTLEFEAKGNESWTVNGEVFDRVPRSLTIDGVANNGFHKPASVFLTSEWTLYRFSIIADSNTPPPLVFGVSEQIGNAAIRNIRLYQGGSERWMREFKNGRVYLNMTKTPWTVNVGTGVVQRLVGTQIPDLNNGAVINGLLTVPAWDAVFLRTGTFEAWQSAYFGMAVSDDFSTGFDGRNVGDLLAGFNVQTGFGTWADAYTVGTGSLNGGMGFVAGGLAESVGGGGGVYVPLAELGTNFSMEVVITPNDFTNGNFTMGFFETIDKGYLTNINSDDVLKFRYIHSGSNAGRFQFSVLDEGVLSNNVYSVRAGSETVNASDKVRLTLSYNTINGEIVGTAYDVTGGYELSAKTINVPGLANIFNAGFGWSSIPNQTTTPSANPGIVSSFNAGNPMGLLGQSISGASADPDGDGFSNLQEYIAGTDPLNAQSQFVIGGGAFDATQSTLDWSSVSGRVYDVYWTTNLLDPFVPLQTDIVWPQSSYTNTLAPEDREGFYKIEVRRP